MSRLIALFLLLVMPGATFAGAWQRDAGSGFTAAHVRLSWPQDMMTWTSLEPTSRYDTIYLEYGLTDRLMLGLDLGRSVSGQTKKIVFAQMPLRSREGGLQIAGQLGFGQIADRQVIRPGLLLGWGLQNGWLSVDTLAEIATEDGATDWKSDITWGRTLPKGRKLMLQVQMGVTSTDPEFVRIAPSVVTPLGKYLKVETGVSYGVWGDSSMGVTMGLWAEF